MTDSGKYAVDGLSFHPADYAMFIVLLVVAAALGVYSGVAEIREKRRATSGKKATLQSRDFGVVPVAFSMMASLVASPFVLGAPVEVYLFGTLFSLLNVGLVLGMFITVKLLLSVFYKMGITSIYEYIERRFSKTLRRTMTAIFASSMLIYMGIIVYSPAIALNSVTGISVEMSVIVVGIIGTIYTSIGGLRGVIWVDVIQMAILFLAFFVIIIKGTVDAGGPTLVWQNSLKGGRVTFNNFKLAPTERCTFWTQVVGGGMMAASFITNQAIVQKLVGLPTIQKMYNTMYTTMLIYTIYFSMFIGAGLVMFGYYYGCDPILLQRFRPDQLLPVFSMKIFENLPGMTGVVVAAVFASSLSSVACGINALSAVTILDLINPICRHYNKPQVMDLKPMAAMAIFKGLSLFYGLLTIAVAFLAELLGQSLLQLAISLLGLVGGPMLGVFIMGVFMPWINTFGATSGLIMSVILTFWVAAGSVVTGASQKTIRLLPLTRQFCPVLNVTSVIVPMARPPVQQDPLFASMPGLEAFYQMSFMWYTTFAVLVCITVAVIVSYFTGFNKGDDMDRTLIHPMYSKDLVTGRPYDFQQDKKQPPNGEVLPSFYTPGEDTKPFSTNHCDIKAEMNGLDNPAFTDLSDSKM